MGMMDIRRGLLGGVEPPPVTVTGDIAHFNATKNTKALSTQVTFTPYQDLHGYDYPWPGGGNINKLKPNVNIPFTQDGVTVTLVNGAFHFNGKATQNTYIALDNHSSNYVEVPHDANDLTLYFGATGANMPPIGPLPQMYVSYYENGQASMISQAIVYGNTTAVIVTPTSADSVIHSKIEFYIPADYTCNDATLYPIFTWDGNADLSTWKPWENICPIEGFVEGEIEDSGKNLFANNTSEIKEIQYYTTDPNAKTTRYGYEIYLPAGTYTISAEFIDTPSSIYIYGGVYKSDGQRVGGSKNIVTDTTLQTQTATINEGEKLMFFDGTSSSSIQIAQTRFACLNIMLNRGDSAATYVPYRAPNTINITFPAVGKNIKDFSTVDAHYYIDASGNKTSSSSWDAFSISGIQVGQDLTYSVTQNNASYPSAIACYDSSGTALLVRQLAGTGRKSTSITIPNNTDIIWMSLQHNMTIEPMLELGSSASSYEPFNNTIYGATIDSATGNGEINWVEADLGDFNWSYQENNLRFNTSSVVSTIKYGGTGWLDEYIFSDRYKLLKGTSPSVDFVITEYASTGNIYIKDTRYNDTSVFKAAVAGTKIVYNLATPIPIHIDPSKLRLPAGTNYVSGVVKNGSLIKNVDSVSVTARYIEPIITE